MQTQTDPSGVEPIGLPASTDACPWVILVPVTALVTVVWGIAVGTPSGPATIPATITRQPNLPAETEKVSSLPSIEGRSLNDWRELMNTLDHSDPSRSRYVPGLIEIVQSSEVPWFTRRQAALTLGRWGLPAAAAVPVLEQLLGEGEAHAEETTCFWALKGLSLFGPFAQSTVPKVSQIVMDAHRPDDQRLAAMECLSQIGTANPSGLIPLLKITQSASQDQNSVVLRRGAVEAIGLFRGGAPAAVPALIHLLDDPDTDLRREAAASLGRQGPSAEIAQAALFDTLVNDPDPAVRDAAGVALAQTGPGAISALVSLLDQDEPELRTRGATVLGKFGRVARSMAPSLKGHWDDPEAAVRLATLEAFWRVTGSGEAVAERIALELASDERVIRRQAYMLLIALGPAARPAKLVFVELLSHSRPEIRAAARKLLQQ